MEDGPAVTQPYPDPENIKEVIKNDKFMKETYQNELGTMFETFQDGVVTGNTGEDDV
jgi:hypothetical protein